MIDFALCASELVSIAFLPWSKLVEIYSMAFQLAPLWEAIFMSYVSSSLQVDSQAQTAF